MEIYGCQIVIFSRRDQADARFAVPVLIPPSFNPGVYPGISRHCAHEGIAGVPGVPVAAGAGACGIAGATGATGAAG